MSIGLLFSLMKKEMTYSIIKLYLVIVEKFKVEFMKTILGISENHECQTVRLQER
jgi:hypothetical protein